MGSGIVQTQTETELQLYNYVPALNAFQVAILINGYDMMVLSP